MEEAEPWARRAHDVLLETVGPDHPYYAVSPGQLAEVLAHRGESEEAEASYRRALDILMETYGEGHPEAEGMVRRLGDLMEGLGRPAEADSLRRAAAGPRNDLDLGLGRFPNPLGRSVGR